MLADQVLLMATELTGDCLRLAQHSDILLLLFDLVAPTLNEAGVGLSVICDKDPMPKSGPHSYAFFWRPPGYRTLNKDPIWSFW